MKLFSTLQVVGGSITWKTLALALAELRQLFTWTLNPKDFSEDTPKLYSKNSITCILQRLSSDHLHDKDFFGDLQQHHQFQATCNIAWKMTIMAN